MAAVFESRTVTTRGKFEHLEALWDPTALYITAIIDEPDEHHLRHPHYDPLNIDFKCQCPHKFWLRRQRNTPVEGRASSSELSDDELIFHLSDSVRTMYIGWSMECNFFSQNNGIFEVDPITIAPASDSIEWKTIPVGKSWGQYFRSRGEIHFTLKWFREDPALLLDRTRRELNDLKRGLSQMSVTMIEASKRPSIDITHLVFCSRRSGAFKHLYVQSHILTQFGHFQRCHSAEYPQSQHTDKAKRKMDETENPDESLHWDDSDDEWDDDSDDDEPKKDATFKTTIHVTDTSRRTFRAFIDYAICGALYFAPLRSAYQAHYKPPSLQPPETGQSTIEDQRNPWPQWAEDHSTAQTAIPGFKTLSSPKSMFRLADKLCLSKLKAICHKQIIDSLEVKNLITEIRSPVFKRYKELRVDAYELVRENWQLLTSSDRISLMTHLAQDEAALVDQHIFKNLFPGVVSSDSLIAKS